MVNAQDWLDQNYPREGECIRETEDEGNDREEGWNNKGKKRAEIIKLDISSQELEGDLELKGFANLEILDCFSNKNITALKIIGSSKLKCLDCSDNKITELDVSVFPELEIFYCSDNLLTSLNLSQNEKLKDLKMSDNNFPTQDLSFLSHLVNLEGLQVGNIMHWENSDPNLYNHFSGSLEPLKNLNKLEMLEIANTDIDSGLEHLPDSLTSFDCSVDGREDAKVKKLATWLRKYGEPKDEINFFPLLSKWKRERKIEKLAEEVQELQKSTKELKFLSAFSFLLLAVANLVLLSKSGKDKNQSIRHRNKSLT